MKYSEIPLVLLMFFTLVYATIGDPNSELWNGAYFLVNYITQLFLFKSHKSKIIRIGGISLTLAILAFIVIKYFLKIEVSRYYTMIPFLICLFTLINIEYKRQILK
jgi:hypothetical protein